MLTLLERRVRRRQRQVDGAGGRRSKVRRSWISRKGDREDGDERQRPTELELELERELERERELRHEPEFSHRTDHAGNLVWVDTDGPLDRMTAPALGSRMEEMDKRRGGEWKAARRRKCGHRKRVRGPRAGRVAGWRAGGVRDCREFGGVGPRATSGTRELHGLIWVGRGGHTKATVRGPEGECRGLGLRHLARPEPRTAFNVLLWVFETCKGGQVLASFWLID